MLFVLSKVEGMTLDAVNSSEIASAPTDPPRMSASLLAAVVEAAYILDVAGRG
jgi:hypothetical protein